MFAKWIPADGRFSFNVEDNGGVEITDSEHSALIDGIPAGKIIIPDAENRPVLVDKPQAILTLDQTLDLGETAIQQTLDTFAGSWGYGNPPGAVGSITQALTYMNSTNEKWKAEAVSLNAWRDSVWAWGTAQLEAISANPALMASTIEEFIAGIPAAPARPAA